MPTAAPRRRPPVPFLALAAAAALAAALPATAAAEPAVVKVFEAPARAAPAPDAAVVHTFVEGASVSVSEQGERGWRRVRLPDGGTGWIEEAALRLGPAAAPAPPDRLVTPSAALPPAEPARPDLKPRIYVKDLDHLAELTRSDPVLGARTLALAERQAKARNTLIATGLASLGLIVLGIVDPWKEPCPQGELCVHPMSGGAKFAFGAGLTVPWIGGAMAWSVAPKQTELLDLLNDWNVRHPDDQFNLHGLGPAQPATMGR